MTGDQRADIAHFAEALGHAAGLHVDPADCSLLGPALRALLKEAEEAEVEAWETVEKLVATLERAVANGDGIGIFKGRCAPIAAAIRGLLAPKTSHSAGAYEPNSQIPLVAPFRKRTISANVANPLMHDHREPGADDDRERAGRWRVVGTAH